MFEGIKNSRLYKAIAPVANAARQATIQASDGYPMGVVGLVAWVGALSLFGGFGTIGTLKIALGLVAGSAMLNGLSFVPNNNDFSGKKLLGGALGAVLGFYFLGPVGMGLACALGRELGESPVLKPANLLMYATVAFGAVKHIGGQVFSVLSGQRPAHTVANELGSDAGSLLGRAPSSLLVAANSVGNVVYAGLEGVASVAEAGVTGFSDAFRSSTHAHTQ